MHTQVLLSEKGIKRSGKKVKLDWRILLLLVYVVSFLAITTVGFWGLPPSFEVEPEYLTGMLTASAIIFGFWAILAQIKPEDIVEKSIYQHYLSKPLFFSLLLLTLSVVTVYFSALNKLSSVAALYVCMWSFLSNTVFITLALYYQRFPEKLYS